MSGFDLIERLRRRVNSVAEQGHNGISEPGVDRPAHDRGHRDNCGISPEFLEKFTDAAQRGFSIERQRAFGAQANLIPSAKQHPLE
jgi:hypothetical protein